MRGFEAEAFSGSVIEAVNGEGDIFRRDGIEVHFFGEELPDEPVHILIGPSLPRSVGMREEEIEIQFLSDFFMLSELLTIVGG